MLKFLTCQDQYYNTYHTRMVIFKSNGWWNSIVRNFFSFIYPQSPEFRLPSHQSRIFVRDQELIDKFFAHGWIIHSIWLAYFKWPYEMKPTIGCYRYSSILLIQTDLVGVNNDEKWYKSQLTRKARDAN